MTSYNPYLKFFSQTKCGDGTSCYRDGSNVRCLPDFECMKSKGREVFNHFYNADSITEDLELVSECRRTDDEPVEGQSLPDLSGLSRTSLRRPSDKLQLGFTCGNMYQGLKGSKVVIKQRDNLMERQITILEQSKYEDFKAICDDAEGNGISDCWLRKGIY